MVEGLFFVFFFALSIAGMLVLYAFIEGETDDLPRMNREDGEQAARADTWEDAREQVRNDRD